MWLFKRWWHTLAVLGLILYAVLTPDPPQPEGLRLFEGADKVVHACMMATLCAVAVYDRRRAGLRCSPADIAAVALWVMAFGVLTELMQSTLTDVRTGDPFDVLADWAGTAAAATAALVWLRTPSGARDTSR
ncbi:MAG: VanZ family protein [Muribaculaceae bacterium]|nr:VanZ family protein [Muribaculaceae bacterium]